MTERHWKFWILKDGVPTSVRREEWAWWMEHSPAERVIAQTQIDHETWVSTVFLGLDHYFGMDPAAPPILFETMIFRGKRGEDQQRYLTREDALRGHEEMVAKALGEDNPTTPYDRRGD